MPHKSFSEPEKPVISRSGFISRVAYLISDGNGNSCLILISSQVKASERVANLCCCSFFWPEVQFPSNPFQYLLGRDILLSTEKLVLRYMITISFSFLYFQRFFTPVNHGQDANTSRHTLQIAMAPPRHQLQNMLFTVKGLARKQ